MLKRKDYDQIKDVLKGIKLLQDPQKRFNFKKKKYILVDNVANRKVEDGRVKQVVYLEQFFEIIYEVHFIQRIHQGIQKTFDQVLLRYT